MKATCDDFLTVDVTIKMAIHRTAERRCYKGFGETPLPVCPWRFPDLDLKVQPRCGQGFLGRVWHHHVTVTSGLVAGGCRWSMFCCFGVSKLWHWPSRLLMTNSISFSHGLSTWKSGALAVQALVLSILSRWLGAESSHHRRHTSATSFTSGAHVTHIPSGHPDEYASQIQLVFFGLRALQIEHLLNNSQRNVLRFKSQGERFMQPSRLWMRSGLHRWTLGFEEHFHGKVAFVWFLKVWLGQSTPYCSQDDPSSNSFVPCNWFAQESTWSVLKFSIGWIFKMLVPGELQAGKSGEKWCMQLQNNFDS